MKNIKPEIVEVDYILDNVIKDCRDNCLQKFENRCVYNIELTNIAKQ